MNEPNDELERIDRWLLEVSEGTASPAESARINALLATNVDLRKAVARRLMEQSLICEELQVAAAESLFHGQSILPMTSDSPSAGARRWSGGRWWMVTAGAVAACVALASLFALRPPNLVPGDLAGSEDTTVLDTEGVAMLTRSVDVVWDPSLPTARVNDRIAARTLKLSSGLIQLEFFSGATLVLEGPAELEIVSAMRCECRLGKLRADVPPQASGFTVGGGSLDVVDLGTEFAMRVEEAGAGEVHVLNGEVSIQRVAKPDPPRRLEKGGAVSFTSAGLLSDLPVAPESFVGSARLDELDRSNRAATYLRWLKHSQTWAKDPAMALYFDFENQQNSDRRLVSAIAQAPATAEGAIVGCRWIEGRFEGKGALEFKRTSDQVRVHLPGEFPSLSLVVWLRIEGFDQWYSSLLLADAYDAGEVHWQITREGLLKLSANGWPGYASPPILKPQDLGRWVQLATVFDGQAQEVRHYLDGAKVSTHPVETQGPTMVFGNAEIGNWHSNRRGKNPIRSLNGRMDEIAVFRRALSDDEIRASYEAGTPSPASR